jgi:hypothetical protein
LFLSRGKVFYNQSLIHISKGNLGLVFPLVGCHILKHCVQKFITKQNFHLGSTICFEIFAIRITIQIPPESQFFIPVTIPKIECLSRYGVLEPSVDLFETCEINLTP